VLQDSDSVFSPPPKESSPSKATGGPAPTLVHALVKTQTEVDHVTKGRLLGEGQC